MLLEVDNLYDDDGSIRREMRHLVSGHRYHRILTHGLTFLSHQITAHRDFAIKESADEGFYISLVASQPVTSVEDFDAIRLAYSEISLSGEISIKQGETRQILQICVSPDQLAAALSESKETVVEHLRHLINQLGERKILTLPLTQRVKNLAGDLLPAAGNVRLLSLLGQCYSLTLLIVEQCQTLHHFQKCADCQSKLFKAQNLVEAAQKPFSSEHLAQRVGLNTEALELGFHQLTGQPLKIYQETTHVMQAAALIRKHQGQQHTLVADYLERWGYSTDQFNALFLRHFGVPTTQYGQVH